MMQHLGTMEICGVALTLGMLAFGYIGGIIQWLREKRKESDQTSANLLNELSGAPD